MSQAPNHAFERIDLQRRYHVAGLLEYIRNLLQVHVSDPLHERNNDAAPR